jgi:hypothetical protein
MTCSTTVRSGTARSRLRSPGLLLAVQLQLLAAASLARLRSRVLARGDAGQSTAEYALVLLGAASVALLLVAWATKTDRITKLLDEVVDQVLEQVS